MSATVNVYLLRLIRYKLFMVIKFGRNECIITYYLAEFYPSLNKCGVDQEFLMA